MSKTTKLIISGVLVLAVMGMIFFFSSQSKDDSKAVSNSLTETIVKIFDGDFENKTQEEKDAIIGKFDGYVRKAAHLTEYALLGITLVAFFWNMKKKWYIPVIIGVLYAASDEIHQALVGSRGPLVTDVLIDAVGLIIGMAIATLVIKMVINHKNKKCFAKKGKYMKKKLWIFFIGVACLLVLAFIVTLLIDYFVNYEFGSSPFWVYVVLRSLECIIPAIAFFIVGCILKKKLNQE